MKLKIINCASVLLATILFGCHGGGSSHSNQFTLKGYTVNLTGGDTLVLKNNSQDPLSIKDNGPFQFSQLVAKGESYNVTVALQPFGQYCSIVNGRGDDVDQDIANVTAYCSSNEVSIGGRVHLFNTANTAELSLFADNGFVSKMKVDQAESSFKFADKVPLYSSYAIKASAGVGNKCTVANSNGIAAADVNNINIVCSDKLEQVSGNVKLTDINPGSTVKFINKDNDESFVVKLNTKTDNPFSFTVPDGGSYYLINETPGVYCSIDPNKVFDIRENKSGVNILCGTPVSIYGTVFGLPKNGLLGLENLNTGEIQYATEHHPDFRFRISYDSGYNIQVISAPDGYSNKLTNAYQKSGVTHTQKITATVKQTYFLLHKFTGDKDGATPNGPLVFYPDAASGVLYGTTESGGTYNKGTIFKIDTKDGSFHPLYSFGGKDDVSYPNSGLILVNGKLFGTTIGDGESKGAGIYQYDPDHNTVTALHKFEGNYRTVVAPIFGVVAYQDKLYGMSTTGGDHSAGSIYKLNLDGSGYKPSVYSFNSCESRAVVSDGCNPLSSLAKATINGHVYFYGTTVRGGEHNIGTIYQFDPENDAMHFVHSFAGNGNGFNPAVDSLIQAGDGNLYGVVNASTYFDPGLIYKLSPASEFSVVYRFPSGQDYTRPGQPISRLLAVGDYLYGVTEGGGVHGVGTLYNVSITSPVTANILYSFKPSDAIGFGTIVTSLSLISDDKNNLYGVTTGAVTQGSYGTIYKLHLQ